MFKLILQIFSILQINSTKSYQKIFLFLCAILNYLIPNSYEELINLLKEMNLLKKQSLVYRTNILKNIEDIQNIILQYINSEETNILIQNNINLYNEDKIKKKLEDFIYSKVNNNKQYIIYDNPNNLKKIFIANFLFLKYKEIIKLKKQLFYLNLTNENEFYKNNKNKLKNNNNDIHEVNILYKIISLKIKYNDNNSNYYKLNNNLKIFKQYINLQNYFNDNELINQDIKKIFMISEALFTKEKSFLFKCFLYSNNFDNNIIFLEEFVIFILILQFICEKNNEFDLNYQPYEEIINNYDNNNLIDPYVFFEHFLSRQSGIRENCYDVKKNILLLKRITLSKNVTTKNKIIKNIKTSILKLKNNEEQKIQTISKIQKNFIEITSKNATIIKSYCYSFAYLLIFIILLLLKIKKMQKK